jgi:hypothetical protein
MVPRLRSRTIWTSTACIWNHQNSSLGWTNKTFTFGAPQATNARNGPDDVDVCLYSLRKWAGLAAKGQPDCFALSVLPELFPEAETLGRNSEEPGSISLTASGSSVPWFGRGASTPIARSRVGKLKENLDPKKAAAASAGDRHPRGELRAQLRRTICFAFLAYKIGPNQSVWSRQGRLLSRRGFNHSCVWGACKLTVSRSATFTRFRPLIFAP